MPWRSFVSPFYRKLLVPSSLTVSTVAEAAYFAAHHFRDNVTTATAASLAAEKEHSDFSVFVEIDTGGRRAASIPKIRNC